MAKVGLFDCWGITYTCDFVSMTAEEQSKSASWPAPLQIATATFGMLVKRPLPSSGFDGKALEWLVIPKKGNCLKWALRLLTGVLISLVRIHQWRIYVRGVTSPWFLENNPDKKNAPGKLASMVIVRKISAIVKLFWSAIPPTSENITEIDNSWSP